MTYQEKYADLHSKYQKSGKELEQAIEKLSETNGFGDLNDISNYEKSQRNFKYAESQFQKLLKYVTDSKIDPATEFNTCEYIYGIIKNDQLKKGINLKDYEPYPNEDGKWEYYSCNIGLTNSDEIKKEYQHSFYLFPVLNLKHGKECYAYLSDKLQNNPDEEFDIDSLDFKKVIDESKPIFVKVSLGIK
tara:strand:+ start:525 stop:1091 length:567 start_codon:yes stop_codon:yes gene_type:complete